MSRANKIITLIGVGFVLLSVLAVLSAELLPLAIQKQEFKKTVSEITSADIIRITVSDPLKRAEGDLMPGNSEYSTSDSAEIEALAAAFASALGEVGGNGRDKDDAGSWDIRLRFTLADDRIFDIFLREADIYTTKGITKYFFTPKDTEEYGRFYLLIKEKV